MVSGEWGSTTLPAPRRDSAAGPGVGTPSHQPANGRTSSPSDPGTGHSVEQQACPPCPWPLIHHSPGRCLHTLLYPRPLTRQLPGSLWLTWYPNTREEQQENHPQFSFFKFKIRNWEQIFIRLNQKFARESKPQL